MIDENLGRMWLTSAVNDALIVGKRVAIFAGVRSDSRGIFKEIKDYLERRDLRVDFDRVCAVNGRERIDLLNGGELVFYSLRQIPYGSHRGNVLDVVYWPASAATDKCLQEVVPALATSRDGRIVRYVD